MNVTAIAILDQAESLQKRVLCFLNAPHIWFGAIVPDRVASQFPILTIEVAPQECVNNTARQVAKT